MRARSRRAVRGPKRTEIADEPVRARCDEPAPPALRRAIEQLNDGELFEQHETLETLWRATRTPVRDLYHGIIQVGVGLYHWSRGNFHGGAVLMAEGIEHLRPFAPSCQGVDVARLVADATALREELLALGEERMRERDPRRALTVRYVFGASSTGSSTGVNEG